jgi:hypothetical protein
MKRDMDLVRQILIVIEDHEHGFAPAEIVVPATTPRPSVITCGCWAMLACSTSRR